MSAEEKILLLLNRYIPASITGEEEQSKEGRKGVGFEKRMLLSTFINDEKIIISRIQRLWLFIMDLIFYYLILLVLFGILSLFLSLSQLHMVFSGRRRSILYQLLGEGSEDGGEMEQEHHATDGLLLHHHQQQQQQQKQQQDEHLLTKEHIETIAKRQWKSVLAWITFHGHDELKYVDRRNQTALHHACLFRAPVDVIEMMLWGSPELASMSNVDNEIPLHWAVRLSSPYTVIQRLLMANPASGVIAKDHTGHTPLSLLWDRHEDDLVEAMKQGGKNVIAALPSWKRILFYLRCYYHAKVANHNNFKENREDVLDNDDSLVNLEGILQVCGDNSSRKNNNKTTITAPSAAMGDDGGDGDGDDDDDGDDDGGVPSAPPELHVAAMCPCPPGLFTFMLHVYADQLDQPDKSTCSPMPLHTACMSAMANHRTFYDEIIIVGEQQNHQQPPTRQQLRTIPVDTSNNNLHSLIHAYPKAVTITNPTNGRLPFWEAIAAGITWNDGIERLLHLHPHSLHGVDPVTQLPAFLLSATAITRLTARTTTVGGNDNDRHKRRHNNVYDYQSDIQTTVAATREATTPMVDARVECIEPCKEEEEYLSTIYTLLRRDPSQLQRTATGVRGKGGGGGGGVHR